MFSSMSLSMANFLIVLSFSFLLIFPAIVTSKEEKISTSENNLTTRAAKSTSAIYQSFLQAGQKFIQTVVIPYGKLFFRFIKFFQIIFAMPIALFYKLPALRIESATWYVQPFPIRVVQWILPIFTCGDLSVFTMMKMLIPLHIRLFLSLFPLPTGPYEFPRGIAGLLPRTFTKHLQIKVPSGDFVRLAEVVPRILRIPKLQLPYYVYQNILDLLPKKFRTLQNDLGIPTILVKPFEVLGLFPRYFTQGPSSPLITTAILVLRIGAPLVFVTFFLNPLNVPGAILLGIASLLPSLYVFYPLRWLNPFILIKLILGVKPKTPIF